MIMDPVTWKSLLVHFSLFLISVRAVFCLKLNFIQNLKFKPFFNIFREGDQIVSFLSINSVNAGTEFKKPNSVTQWRRLTTSFDLTFCVEIRWLEASCKSNI